VSQIDNKGVDEESQPMQLNQERQLRSVRLPPLLGTAAPASRQDPPSRASSTKNSNPKNPQNELKQHDMTSHVMGIGLNEEAKEISSRRSSGRKAGSNKFHVHQSSLGISTLF